MFKMSDQEIKKLTSKISRDFKNETYPKMNKERKSIQDVHSKANSTIEKGSNTEEKFSNEVEILKTEQPDICCS